MINGVINVRKERGMTSFVVVSRLRKIFGQKKIGHTGTLDPDAEGVLPVCLGRATRLVEDLSHGTKSYEAVLLLGKNTDTEDAGGRVLSEKPVTCTAKEAEEAVLSFAGKQMQRPPMYSAIKIKGRKLVDLARKGIEVERPEREVEISEIRIGKIDLPRVYFSVTVSHGTYIRTLCRDIGEKLGCGGCMESLLRTRVEEFKLEDAMTLDEIAEKKKEEDAQGLMTYSFVLPIDHFYRMLPEVTADSTLTSAIVNGGSAPSDQIHSSKELSEGQRVRLYLSDGRFAGIYHKKGDLFRLEKYYCDTAAKV